MKKASAIFLVAVILQVLILIGVPARKAFTRATGRTVVLKVAPVDPYSILSGYYVILGYDISRPADFPNAPKFEPNEVIYAVVEQQPDGLWKAVGIDRALPKNLPANQVAIRGRWDEWRIKYGIEEFYIPEEKRSVIGDDLGKNQAEARVDVKVDAGGNAALLRLRIQDRVYE